MINFFAAKTMGTKVNILLRVIMTTAILCLIFIFAHRAIFDPDIWLHLKAGELILQNKTVPSSDVFSFTLQGRPWIDHSWLFQLLVYLIYNKWQL